MAGARFLARVAALCARSRLGLLRARVRLVAARLLDAAALLLDAALDGLASNAGNTESGLSLSEVGGLSLSNVVAHG
jgi:hypothetical protein